MREYHAPFEPEGIYHVYNHGIGNELTFRSNENYAFFLNKYWQYISPVADTYCYCLLPNHFHFVIRCKNIENLTRFFDSRRTGAENKTLTGFFKNSETLLGFTDPRRDTLLANLISQQFSNFFNSYTQAFNRVYGRMVGLFIRQFNKIRIRDEVYLKKLIIYIHLNPVKAALCHFPEDWKHSSIKAILSNENANVISSETVRLFEDLENFRFVHRAKTDWEPDET